MNFPAFLGIVSGILLLNLNASAGAVNPTVSWPQQESDIPADASVTYGSLPNGMRYAVMKNAEPPKRVSLRLYVNAGSLMETEDERGTAHFLEHMAFNGNRHHPGNEIVEYFQRLGMDFVNDTNAYTTFDRTVYILELPNTEDATMAEAMQALRDYADGDLLNEDDAVAERGVILAEKRTWDSSNYRQRVDSFQFSLPDSLIPQRMTIGEESVISTMTREKLLSFYKKWYTPDRLTLIVTGDMDTAKVEELAKQYFGDMPANAAPQKNPDLGAIKPRGTVTKVLRDAEAAGISISISNLRQLPRTPDTASDRQHRIALDAANAIVTRRLQIMMKQEGAVFSGGSCVSYRMLNFIDGTEIDLGCNPDQWAEALAVAEQQLRKALLHGFTEVELAEAVANIRNNYEQQAKQATTRKSSDLANRMASCISNNQVFSTPEEDLKIASQTLGALTPESVLKEFQNAWNDNTRIVYVAGNLPETATQESVLAAYQASAAKSVEAPKAVEKVKFAYSDIGKPGEVVWRNEVKDLGITQLKFANNVYVNIKTSDVEKDAVHIRVQFGTGVLEQPKDKEGLGTLATLAFANGGLKAHSADEIKSIFAGQTVGSYFQVLPDYFMLGSKTSPKDLEAQMNLFAAYMIAPGFRDDGLSPARSQLAQMYNYIEHVPQGIVMMKLDKFLSEGDSRMGMPDQDKVLALTMNDMRAWLEPSLNHARVEISIYGDISVDAVIPMLARTFGALPERDAEKPDLAAVRKVSITTEKTKTFEYSTEIPKGLSIVAWQTDDSLDLARNNRLMVLSSIISDRMRVELREKLGDTYSPMAVNPQNEAFTHYGFMVCMCEVSPDKIGEVSTAIRSAVADIAAKGVTQDELDRALKPLTSMMEIQQRNADYWTGYIMGSCQEHPEKLDWARHIQEDLRSITVADINKTAAQYLQPDKAIDIRIVPQAGKEK